jgi:hypothetical protein
MIENARDLVERRYSWRIIADEFIRDLAATGFDPSPR